jgi:hypothetical protein
MTDDLIETLAAADPLRGCAPTAAESARMDGELQRLLALATAETSASLPALAEARRDVVAAPNGVAPPRDLTARDSARPRGPLARRRAARIAARGRGRVASRWVAIGLVGVAAAVVAFAVPDQAPHQLRPAPATAATVLSELSGKVAVAPAGTGKYAYEKQVAYISHMRPKPGGKGTFVVVLPHTGEQWVSADGTAIMRGSVAWDQPTFPTPEDKADYEASPKNESGWDSSPHKVVNLTLAGLTPAEVQALPTDPAALLAKLTDPHLELTARVGQLLGSALTPPAVKVALFEVLRGLPGATLVPDTKDPQGRTGIGVQFDSDAWKTLFLFDPQTGALLGTRSIGHKEIPGRDIDDWSLVLESDRTDDAPTPTGRTLTIPVA